MRLQVAFDDVSLSRCLEILARSAPEIDIIEVGTLLLLREGLAPLREIRARYPDKTILADPKIMDAPEKLASSCFDAGADIVTVMAAAEEAVVRRVIDLARERGKQSFLDLLAVRGAAEKLPYFDGLGADILCLHAAKTADAPPYETLRLARAAGCRSALAIAGGVGPDSIGAVAALAPDVIVAGGSVYAAADPAAAIRALRRGMT